MDTDSTHTLAPSADTSSSRTVLARALVLIGAFGAALALWVLADPVGGIDLTARQAGTDRPVGPGAVAVAGLVSGLAAWGLLATLERFARRPRRLWNTIAIAVLVLSLTGPLSSGAGTGSKVVLVGLHLITAMILIPGLGRTARSS
jgi:hypothetical protein